MREILSKGKRTDNGEWVEGCLLIDYVSGQYFIHTNGNSVNESDKAHEEGCLKFFAFEVDPETVCQYTGLTDKNGGRYEGDIFQADNGDCIQIYIIVWDEYLLQWSAECIGDPDGTLPLCEFRVDEIEVIGNIFDNPELLEGRSGENAD